MSISIATQVQRWIAAAVLHGGQRQRAAGKAEAILGALSLGRDPQEVGRTAAHGENRLACTKYDLGNGFRLVTLRRGDTLILLRLDNHDAIDRWLDQQRGKDLELEGVVGVFRLPEPELPSSDEPAQEAAETQRLIAALSDADLDELPLRASAMRALTRLTPNSSDQELAEAVSDLGSMRQPILQVLQFLRNGDNERARQTLHRLHSPPAPKVAVADEADEEAPRSLSKKKRRAARRAARAGQTDPEESSFNRMDQEYLRLLRNKAKSAAEQARLDEEQARKEQHEEEGLSFAELLARFEGGGDRE